MDNLNAHIRETRKAGPAPLRHEAILELLVTLVRQSFDYRTTARVAKEQLVLLKKGENGYRWDPLGPEVVCVHHWFETQINAQDEVATGGASWSES